MAITEISVSKIYVLATEPTNKIKDRFWFDTTNNLLKRYDGTTWKPISVSSDDVVVLSSGSKVSLTNYLNTQIAALAEGIDTKQDKLTTYKESNGNVVVSVGNSKSLEFRSISDDLAYPKLTLYNRKIGIGAVSITGESASLLDVVIDDSANTTALSGSLISNSISSNSSDYKLPTEKAVYNALETKQKKLYTYSETIPTDKSYPEEVVITAKGQNFLATNGAGTITLLATDSTDSGDGFTAGTINLNATKVQKKGKDIATTDDLANKQNSTDSTLNTTDKTIVGAINELLAAINTNVITSTEQKRITTTSTSAGIQMSTTAKACMVSINPVKTNVGAIYISTSSDTAPTINPLYPDQMPKYKFPDASQVYIWSDVNGDSVDLTIEYYG